MSETTAGRYSRLDRESTTLGKVPRRDCEGINPPEGRESDKRFIKFSLKKFSACLSIYRSLLILTKARCDVTLNNLTRNRCACKKLLHISEYSYY